MTHHYSLRKIILIDSFWPNKTVLLKLDGHTNLSGTNGAGKTTFLRLMQLFWGERPSNIVGGSGSKKSFLDYYLPRASHGIERLYRSSVEVSKFVAVDDYCSVIQCHQLTGGKNDLRLLQKRYAMAATPMTHIEKVIGSVIEKIGDFDVIKQMLIDISRGKLSQTFLQNEDEQQPFQLNKQHIEAWLADLSASREIEAKRADFDQLLQTIAELKQTLQSLAHLHFLARGKHRTHQQQSEALENSLQELTNQRDQLQQNHTQQLEPKEDVLMEANGRLKGLIYEIEALETQKLNFEEQGAESFGFKGAKAEQYQKQQQDFQAELDTLEHKTQEIKRFYEKQLGELQHRHETQSQSYRQQASDAELRQSQSLREADTEFQLRKDQLLQAKKSRLQPVEEQRTQFSIAFQVKQNQLKNPPISESLLADQLKSHELLEAAGKDSKQAYQAMTEAQTDYQDRLSHYQLTEQAIKDKKTELARTKLRHAELQKRLRPEPGSLQYFLEQEVEGWQQTIGRVIAPELLDHTGLVPQWNDQASQDFYGLSINLEALADRSYLSADKADLERREKELFDQLTKLDKEREELEASLRAINKLREQAKTGLDKAQQRVQQAERLEENLRNEANGLADQVKAETAKTRQQLEQEINRLSSDIEASSKALTSIETEHQQALQELQNEHLARKGIIESDCKNLLTTIAEQTEADIEHFKREQLRIGQQLKSDLKESGADDTHIVTLSAKLKKTEALEQEARSFLRKAQNYQDWLQKLWQQHPKLCRRRDDCQRDIQQLNDQIKQLKQDYQRQRAQLNQNIAAQEEELKKNHRLLAQLEQCMDLLRGSPPVCAEDLPEYATLTLPHLTQESLKDRKCQVRDIQNGKQTLERLLNKHKSSQLSEAWSQALNAAANSSEFFQAEALEIEQPLIDVLQMVGHVKQATAQEIELHASSVNTFYLHLHNFDRAIKGTGAELSKYISEERYFAALGEITVNIRSKMSDLEYWQALKKFGDHYGQYRDNAELNGNHDIPETLVQAMGELTALLPATGVKIKHLSLFDIEFSIHENGQLKHARNARELKDVSSTGLSYLALITFFTGVTSMLRKNNPTVVCWPIDELGDLAPENIEAMMNLLAKQNIQILSATPTADRHVLSLFERRYLLTQQKLHEVELPPSKLEQLLNASSKEAAHV
ncbi:ATP-binding protein [Methylomonas sp. LL1]|uniref:ATP-binding protein n=1 Tax=Methylomonas sp. LL1 TaxID=2785785 RepID=UPI0018C42288|nr:ATP-binding protein [Methylomonas sp. LL1]QPK63931.1 ATP-binding protein [Methylomonas sp. LL1]